MSQSTSNRGTGRTRNYACMVYPDSAPSNWLDIVSESKVGIFVSPLHNLDTNPTGEPKKAHYHVLVMFDAVKTMEQARAFFETFGGVGCETVQSVRGYARYLCHMDNPEKAQYSLDDVKQYGGADFRTAIGTASDKLKSIREMATWVAENDIISFSDVFEYAMVNRSDWFDTLCNGGSYTVKEYIKSRTWKMHQQEEK